MAVRSAESSRKSSCLFADRVAELSIAFYRNICPPELLESFDQTVLATIVVQTTVNNNDKNTGDNKTMLEVISMGVGTKVVAAEDIMSHKAENGVKGDKLVRDSHAEVLARRGFLRYLHNQIRIRIDKSGLVNENDCIFSALAISDDRLVLKPGVKFHLYTSSQPCGNASIKRWAKVKPLRYRDDLSADSFPLESHERIQVTPESRLEGQVALLVKRNGRSSASRTAPLPSVSTNPTQDRSSISSSVTIASEHIPAGTALPHTLEGNVMTCSDKIALWNAVGLQGALLSAFIEPVYFSTITVGRKFSQIHCQRALCCRLQDFQYPQTCVAIGKKGNKKRKQNKLDSPAEDGPLVVDTTNSIDAIHRPAHSAHLMETTVPAVDGTISVPESERKALFSIHHPVMLGTQVKLDEGTIITGPGLAAAVVTNTTDCNGAESTNVQINGVMEHNGNNVPTMGARFLEPRCLVSYASYSSIGTCSTLADTCGHVLEVLDGRTGFLANAPTGSMENKNISTVSSCSLRAAFEALYSVFHVVSESSAGTAELESYSGLKRRVAPNYAAAKESLFSDPLAFAEWTRKSK